MGMMQIDLRNVSYKTITHHESAINLYYFRDSNLNEVDIVYKRDGRLVPVEIKSAQTFNRQFLDGIRYLQKIAPNAAELGYVIYAGEGSTLQCAKLVNYRDASKIYSGPQKLDS